MISRSAFDNSGISCLSGGFFYLLFFKRSILVLGKAEFFLILKTWELSVKQISSGNSSVCTSVMCWLKLCTLLGWASRLFRKGNEREVTDEQCDLSNDLQVAWTPIPGLQDPWITHWKTAQLPRMYWILAKSQCSSVLHGYIPGFQLNLISVHKYLGTLYISYCVKKLQ